jgi:hypothetical protein
MGVPSRSSSSPLDHRHKYHHRWDLGFNYFWDCDLGNGILGACDLDVVHFDVFEPGGGSGEGSEGREGGRWGGGEGERGRGFP